MRVLIVCLIAIFFTTSNYCVAQKYNFQNYTISQGLSHKTITKIFQDSKGFIWIGTTYGLNKFDGYTFKKYYTIKNDSLSLSDNLILDIAEDANGLIWLSTGKGFCFFNPRTESFSAIKDENIGKLTRGLIADDNGNIWGINSDVFLIKLHKDSKLIQYFNIDSLIKHKGIIDKWTLKFFDNKLWICTEIGAICFDEKTQKTQLYSPKNLKYNKLKDIIQGKDNDLIFLYGDYGVYSFNLNSKTFTEKVLFKTEDKRKNYASFTAIEWSYDNKLWLTSVPGLYECKMDGTYNKINITSGSIYNSDNIICNCIYKDNAGNIWIGTMNDGVFVYNQNQKYFIQHTPPIANKGNVPASYIVIDDNGRLYYCNLFGIFECDNYTDFILGKSRQIYYEPAGSISNLPNNELAIYLKDKVIIYSKKNHSFREFKQLDYLFKGYFDFSHTFWLTRWSNGILGIDTKTLQEFKIDVDSIDNNKNTVFTVLSDKDGSLWLGTFGSGLVHVQNPKSKKPIITKYKHSKQAGSISSDFVLSLYDDGKGFLWVGTNGAGLNKFNKQTKEFASFENVFGESNNVIETICGDVDGNIWFASSKNLIKYDIKNYSFIQYGENEGLVSSYFSGASICDTKGRMYFCNDKGIVSFIPSHIQKKPTPITPQLVGFKVFGRNIFPGDTIYGEVPLKTSIFFSDEIRISYEINSFSIEFASIQMNSNVSYMYKLEGIDKEWIVSNKNERTASYNTIPPGTYTFKVMASNGDDTWCAPRKLQIVIVPLWWQTLWFKIIVFVFIACIILLIQYVRVLNLKKKKEELKELVTKRTQDLENANSNLTKQSDQLSKLALNLESKNDEILKKHKLLENKNIEIIDALNAKDKLIEIIAHDFKNPIFGIHGILEFLKKNLNKISIDDIEKYIDSITSSIIKLSEQMVVVLDWAKNQMNEIKCSPEEIDIDTVLKDAIVLVRGNALHKNIEISLTNNCETTAYADSRMIITVFRNILINAIKFTQRGGKISIEVHEKKSAIEITFLDTGIGISAEKIEKLFIDSSSASSELGTENEIGTGFGLQISKSFIEKNNGTIEVESILHKGTMFKISLIKGLKKIEKHELIETQEKLELQEIPICLDKNQKILIIDDDETIQIHIEQIFEPYYTVIKASDGENGLQLIRDENPNLIISDIHMPKLSGNELCKIIKSDKATSHIPIIIITTLALSDIEIDSYINGADDFIEKPFQSQKLLLKAFSLIENRKKIIAKEHFINQIITLPESQEDEIMRRILEYIHKNFTNANFDLTSIIEEIGISKSQLWRKFNKQTGSNVSNYIFELRMNLAKELLLTNKYRTSEIAYDVGYSDPQYFSRCFLNHFGLSPKEYKTKYSKEL